MNTEEEQRITAVEKAKKARNRYLIYVNEAYAFSVHEDVLVRYRLLKGDAIDPERMAEILREDEKHRAYLDALRFVGVRPRSNKEVKSKLEEKGYVPDLVDWAIAKLTEQHYLDDGEFAKLWTEHRIHSQKKGRKWVQMELAQKGVSKEDIAAALNNIDENAEFEAALQLGRKKWNQSSGEPIEKKRKTAAFLLRRGYSQTVTSNVLKKLTDEPDYDLID